MRKIRDERLDVVFRVLSDVVAVEDVHGADATQQRWGELADGEVEHFFTDAEASRIVSGGEPGVRGSEGTIPALADFSPPKVP